MPQTNSTDIAIVGAGVTGTSILISTIENWIAKEKKGSITIIEKSNFLGPGLPFNPEQPKTLRINDPFNASDIVAQEDYSFFHWLKLENDKGNPEVTVLGVGDKTLDDRFPPRAVYGKYCEWAFKKAVTKAIYHGISIHLLHKTEVVDVLKRDENWELHLNNNMTIKASNLILATGHMPSDHYVEYENTPGFFATPWQDLSHIPAHEAVIVFGSGLSAIDTAKKLHAQAHTGKIYFVSQSGALPAVKPPRHNQTVALQFLKRENVDKPGLTLKEYLHLFQQELNLHTTTPIDFEKKLTTQLDPKSWLEKNIALAEKGVVRTWQLLLDEIYFYSLPYAWKHLSDTDRATLMNHYFGPYLKWAAGTPLANAKEILALLESGQLEIIRGAPQIHTTEKGFELEFSNPPRKIVAKYAINGTNMGHNIDRNPLLNKMRRRKFIAKASQGGIKVDPFTYEVIDPQNEKEETHANLLSAGPTIFGSNPAVYAIEASAFAGRDIGKAQASILPHSLFKQSSKASDTTNLGIGQINRIRCA
ncbi:MAG: hypothetical protein A3F42_00080 [Gammaproteobacteria bacterium RIFCSPHIGHO2_12_FULL_37_34]|nr:MAG: hypothetical protein A3F42_00080 [Gammaproteobacteria bacterium RIFCSPHIGHO2_12_FULL_37_34]